MRKRIVAALGIALLIGTAGATAAPADPTPVPSPAATPAPQASASPHPTTIVELATSRIDTMFMTGHADPSWFSPTFLEKVPPSKVDDAIASLQNTLGKYKSVEFTPAKFVAHFEKGTDDVLLHLDANDKIDGLLFRPPVMPAS